MDWDSVYEATASNAKPAPGWLFKAICQSAQQRTEEVPDLAEYLMQCAASTDSTVAMKGCLTIRHLADEVVEFQRFMQRCPDALQILAKSAEPPQLAQARAVERPEAMVKREAASRALKSILSKQRSADAVKANLQTRIQGFGNYEPPPEEDQKPTGARAVADSVLGFVGDAVADTYDDFKTKGAVGAVRDGVLDTADILRDGVGAVWGFLGGRKVRQEQAAKQEKPRICQPVSAAVAAQVCSALSMQMEQDAQQPGVGGNAATRGNGIQQTPVGAAYGVAGQPQQQQQAHTNGFGTSAVQQEAETPPASTPMTMEDLLSFDDDVGAAANQGQAAATSCADLLSLDDDFAAGISHPSNGAAPGGGEAMTGMAAAERLKATGNGLVRGKRYAEAVKAYEAALEAAAGGAPEAAEFCCAVHANIALCNLQQQLYRRAADSATRSIEIDPTYAKAYYRRCLAYKALKLYSDARKDFEALQYCRHDMSPAEMQRLCSGLALENS